MKVSELVDVIGDSRTRLVGSEKDIEISSVSMDSRSVERGALFCCVRGERFDGHDFASTAIESGAAALLVENVIPGISDEVPQIVVTDIRRSIGPVAARLAGDPSRHMTVVGITGTNGKTTTTHLLAAILRVSGRRTGSRNSSGSPHHPRSPAVAVDVGRNAQSTGRRCRNGSLLACTVLRAGRGNALRSSRLHELE